MTQAAPVIETNREDNGTPTKAVDWENPRVAAILSAAAKCFARKGFSATTLAEIGKELGLRKSIVHYYFASKAALIHEVQSYTYNKYLARVKEAIASDSSGNRAVNALVSLWDAIQNNKTGTGLNIEVWSAARRDSELKRRASGLHRDAQQIIADSVAEALKAHGHDLARKDVVATLILAVLNGLSVTEYLEDDERKAREAYDLFIKLLTGSQPGSNGQPSS
jgi:AcrR family transcriptional regulator